MALSSEQVAGVNVRDRQREERKPNRHHDDVHHANAPRAVAGTKLTINDGRRARFQSGGSRRRQPVPRELSVTNGIGIRDRGGRPVIGIP
jgi:hypothetical protein